MVSWSWGRGWGVYEEMRCTVCGYVWTAVAAIGTRGCTCPACGVRDETLVWEGDDQELPNDGAWLDAANFCWIQISPAKHADDDKATR